MGKKIMLDAGHYGRYNQSPAVKTYYESEAMWKLHLLLKSELESYGFTVGTTRTNQAVDREVYDRGQTAKGYDVLLSLHSNSIGSGGVDESVDYPLVIVPINGSGDKLGKMLASEVAQVMGTRQSGIVNSKAGSRGDYYGVIRGAVAAGSIGIIIEHSFHTQTAATKWLLSDANLERLAQAEAAVLAEYYGMAKLSTPQMLTRGTQASAFAGLSQQAAAEKILELVKADAIKSGIYPSVKAAQMLLESAYVTSQLAKIANNCFGMKAMLSGNSWNGSSWDGKSVYVQPTQEQNKDGVVCTVMAEFRRYDCIEDSIADHSAYLLGAKNGTALRYAGLTSAKDYIEQITIIKNGGYATDVNYIQKVCDVIEKYGFDKHDNPVKVKVALDKLSKEGIINSPDYWMENYGALQYLDTLIINMGYADKKPTEGTSVKTIDQALAMLVVCGVINSPDYWKANYDKVAWLEELLVKVAGRV